MSRGARGRPAWEDGRHGHGLAANLTSESGVDVQRLLVDVGDIAVANDTGSDADAHPDLYDELDGNRLSHASPFARIMEDGLCERLVQVGIRTANVHQRQQAERFGVETVEARAFASFDPGTISGPTYVTVDLDGLDPAFAPGVSHHEPGGLTTRQVLDLVATLPGPIVGADVVELNPTRDVVDMTAMVAAKLLKELTARLAP